MHGTPRYRIEKPDRGLEVIPLAMHLAQTEIQLVRLRSGGVNLFSRGFQTPLIDARRVAKSALRNPDVAEHEDASDGIERSPALPHERECIRECLVRNLEISASPEGERDECGAGRAAGHVARREEIERALRVHKR